MKGNVIKRGRGKGVYATIGVILLAAILAAGLFGYSRCRDLYLELSVLKDLQRQVDIKAGRMVKADVIAENLGLKVGANLALIDFKKKRAEILARVPTLRDITITRHLPDRVSVVSEERVPIVRMNLRGQRAASGRVADSEGVVFLCQRGTQMLPVIREANPPGTHPGVRLSGRTLAALQLVEECRDHPDFAELGLLEVDVSRPDFLLATLGNYARVKIAWDDMDNPLTPASKVSLKERLNNLLKAIRSRVSPDAKLWNATMPGVIFADTQENI